MKKLAIIGSGDLGQQIAWHALHDKQYEPVGFFDDVALTGSVQHGIPVLGKVQDILKQYNAGKFDLVMIAIGYKHMEIRAQLYDQLAGQIPFGTIIHSSVIMDPSCEIGEGSFIYPGCVLDQQVRLGNNVLLNVGTIIAHDSAIGDHSFLSPAVKIAGFVSVAPKSILGIGTTVIDHIAIGAGVRTGAGAVVIKDLDKAGLYVGVPAIWTKI